MFEKLSQAAEKTAAGVSRRNFLGRLGAGAAVVAATLGGVLAQPANAAGRPRKGSCDYYYSDGACRGVQLGSFCGYRSKCVANADLGGGVYACGCRSSGRKLA